MISTSEPRSPTDFAAKLADVKATIIQSGLSAQRNPEDIKLMLVTKTVPAESISQTFKLGHRLFGENRIQEVAKKWTDLSLHGIKPEFIGHLQTNKVRTCLDLCGRIHSVDRLGLAEALDRELQRRGESREIFLQVNISGEESKYGIPWSEALQFAKRLSSFETLEVRGLMTLAIFSKEEVRVRQCFRRLKELSVNIQEAGIFSGRFRELSMGMSSDYSIAVEEGSTLVRVGTAVFGERSAPDSFYWPENQR